MKYKELMDICSEIWREYGEQGNSFLGLCEARQYCVRHISECEDITQEQLTTIQGWQEYKDFQNEIQRKEQPMPDSTKLIELWHEDKEMLKEKDFRDDPWRLAYNAFMCGFGRGIAVKKQEQPVNMIQWTGSNLQEVIDFTGKSPKFGEWFKSWDEFESYVHSHGDILKLFSEDGSHFDVPVGAWIVKTPDGYNVPSVARFIHAKQEQPEVELELEKAARYVYESWMGGTMDDVRRDMVELGKVLNARKED